MQLVPLYHLEGGYRLACDGAMELPAAAAPNAVAVLADDGGTVAVACTVGLYKLTDSLKAPGFNTRTLNVISWLTNVACKLNVYRYSTDGTVRAHDAATGELRRVMRKERAFKAVALAPAPLLLASSGGQEEEAGDASCVWAAHADGVVRRWKPSGDWIDPKVVAKLEREKLNREAKARVRAARAERAGVKAEATKATKAAAAEAKAAAAEAKAAGAKAAAAAGASGADLAALAALDAARATATAGAAGE
jgi:hypothetical protein